MKKDSYSCSMYIRIMKSVAESHGYAPRILQAVEEVNVSEIYRKQNISFGNGLLLLIVNDSILHI